MKPGIIYKTFTAKDGLQVTLRAPRWDDLDDLLTFINAIVDEGVDILKDQKVTRFQEAEWLGRVLADMENGKRIHIVAEANSRVIASALVTKEKGCSSHVGGVGIGISKEYRDLGIGTEILRTIISQSKEMGLQVLLLTVLATNHRALHVYEKVGFRKTGVRPKFIFRNGQYIDDIIMTMELT